MTKVEAPSRIKTWFGVVVVIFMILGVASVWPGDDDDAVLRDQQDSDRRKEAVVWADFTTGAGRELFVAWGKAGAIKRDEDPQAPFERVVVVQRGDRVSIFIQTKEFDSKLSCRIRVNGETYVGESWGYGCGAKANVL